VYTLAKDGRVVIYMGDDQVNEYIYKFVTTGKYNPASRTANLNLLDSGTLYVARFDAGSTTGDNMGTGVWLPLDLTNTAISAFFGGNLGAMLINTRRSADLAGATPMDRPEWIAVNPAGSRYDPASGAEAPFKEVYCSLTNNSGRTVVDAANPRAPNPYGHIIRWQEAGGDAAATTFAWDIFVLAGDPVRNPPPNVQAGNINGDTFGSPDGLWFDSNLRLWIQTDISSGSLGITNYANIPVNMMLCADPVTKEVRRFLTGPYRCEVTGVVTTPDNKTMFVGIQHPGESSGDTGDPTQPEQFSKFPASQGYGAFGRPRSTVVVITKDDGGVIGT
jgi:secreted PhoX family phosphatase